jgi:hypothetical protein
VILFYVTTGFIIMTNVLKNEAYFMNTQGEVYSSYTGKPWQESDKPVSRKEGEVSKVEDAKKYLRSVLKPGMTVYTILNSKSASGMSRCISLVIGGDNGTVTKLDWHVARALHTKIDSKHGGIKRGGCGMDMGFDLVYTLGRTLWPEGTEAPHGKRNGEPDHCGGYALKHQWL